MEDVSTAYTTVIWVTTNPKFVPDLGIGLELPVVGTTSVTPNQSAVLIFHGVFACDIWIYDGPEMGIRCECRRGLYPRWLRARRDNITC
jgi:hypothetical protein